MKIEDVKALAAAADAAGRASIGTALVVAFACVQRISDALRLTRKHVEGGSLRFAQSKTGFKVDMPLPDFVAGRLAAAPPVATASGALTPCETTRRPWSDREAARAFAKIRDALVASDPRAFGHLRDVQLRDARRSGFLHYKLAGCDTAFICSLSGHSNAEANRIVEHYLPKTRAQAELAVAKFGGGW